MYEFRQNSGHPCRRGPPKCSHHFVSLSHEAGVVWNFSAPALSMATHKPHHTSWSDILLTFQNQSLFVLKLSHLLGTDRHEVSQLNGIWLDNVWPCYCLSFKVIVRVDIIGWSCLLSKVEHTHSFAIRFLLLFFCTIHGASNLTFETFDMSTIHYLHLFFTSTNH